MDLASFPNRVHQLIHKDTYIVPKRDDYILATELLLFIMEFMRQIFLLISFSFSTIALNISIDGLDENIASFINKLSFLGVKKKSSDLII